MSLDRNQMYTIVRRAVIHLYSTLKDDELEYLDLGIDTFGEVMSFVKNCYIESTKYKDLCVTGKVKDIK